MIVLLAVRQPSKGPLGVPVNRTAEEANVIAAATAPDWTLKITGAAALRLFTPAEVEELAVHVARFPVSCVEGWSVDAQWGGMLLLEVVERRRAAQPIRRCWSAR